MHIRQDEFLSSLTSNGETHSPKKNDANPD